MVLSDRTDGVYLLPATTQFETYGSVTASNRSLQWREKRSLSLHLTHLITLLSTNLPKSLVLLIVCSVKLKLTNDEPYVEDVTSEFNSGMWTIGYTGQSPERLKAHMANQHVFDRTTLQAVRWRVRR